MHEAGYDLACYIVLQVGNPLVAHKGNVKQKQCQEEVGEDMIGIADLSLSVWGGSKGDGMVTMIAYTRIFYYCYLSLY